MDEFIKFVIEEMPEKKRRGRPAGSRNKKKASQEGEGWIGDKLTAIKKGVQKGVRKVGAVVIGKERAEKIERYGDAVLFLSKLPLPPSVKEYLRKYGDEAISKIVIVRNPVQKLLTGAMNAVSLGSFGKKFGRLPYDDLFHLQLWVTTPSGVFGIEKNEVITMTMNPKPKSNAEFQEVAVKPDLTMNKMMLGSEKIQGAKWTRYDASNNNCQDFVMSLLKGSGLGNENDYKFVKQDTDSLFKDDSFLRKLSRNLTNIGASVSTAISGVDDKPIASTANSDTFEIPSPADTDILEAGREALPLRVSEWDRRRRRMPPRPPTPAPPPPIPAPTPAPTLGALNALNAFAPIQRGRGRPRKIRGGVKTELQVVQFLEAVRRGERQALDIWNGTIPEPQVREMLLRLPNELLLQVLQYLNIVFNLTNFRTTFDEPTTTTGSRKRDPPPPPPKRGRRPAGDFDYSGLEFPQF